MNKIDSTILNLCNRNYQVKTIKLEFYPYIILDLPAQLQALNVNQQRGPPKIAPKPRPAPKPKRNPQARVLYDYDAQDNDEISLQEGQIIEVKMFLRTHYPVISFLKVLKTIKCCGIY